MFKFTMILTNIAMFAIILVELIGTQLIELYEVRIDYGI